MPKILVCLLPVGLAMAQHQMAPPPEKPVTLYPGMGTWRHPIATANNEAQKYFDQGLALLYAFNRYEALRSFRKASELDPKAAMAWWGISDPSRRNGCRILPFSRQEEIPDFGWRGVATE